MATTTQIQVFWRCMLSSGVRIAPTSAILHRINPLHEEETSRYVSSATEIYSLSGQNDIASARLSVPLSHSTGRRRRNRRGIFARPVLRLPTSQRRQAVLVS